LIKSFDLLECPICEETIVLSKVSIISSMGTKPSFVVEINLISPSQNLLGVSIS